MQYKRILLKLSGEALMGQQKFGLDTETIQQICEDIAEAHKVGYQICLVIGGGNICRGATITHMGIERASADNMGMLATVINAIALQGKLENLGIITRVQSATPMSTIAEPYIRRKAIRHMEKNRVVIFSAGTGNPFFTTDTAAALRAAETSCDIILKGTQVDGIYSADPKKDSAAIRYSRLTYKDVIANDLHIMDSAAISLARENKIPILVFNIHKKGELLNVLQHQGTFSLVSD